MSATRLDKWLFHARFYRTRPLAQAAAQAGRVRLNGVRIEKPGHAIKPGDVLTLVGSLGGRGGQVMAVRILALAERRGPAMEAQKLYEVLE
jgi:ribosome-associated heat shock protein Hsp15